MPPDTTNAIILSDERRLVLSQQLATVELQAVKASDNAKVAIHLMAFGFPVGLVVGVVAAAIASSSSDTLLPTILGLGVSGGTGGTCVATGLTMWIASSLKLKWAQTEINKIKPIVDRDRAEVVRRLQRQFENEVERAVKDNGVSKGQEWPFATEDGKKKMIEITDFERSEAYDAAAQDKKITVLTVTARLYDTVHEEATGTFTRGDAVSDIPVLTRKYRSDLLL